MPAAPDQIPTDLTLEIGENLSPERFMGAARAFFGYVQEISHALAPEAEPIRWIVRVRGEVVIFTSALTLAEVLWMRGAPMVAQEKADILRKFFRRSYFRIRNVTRKISEDAQDLVWIQGIGPKDAIHVATALDGHVNALETFDIDLLAKTGTVGNPPLVIRKPMPPAQKGLFDA